MAKDPAFLFYTGDFSTGTQFFNDDELGKYMRLLMAQHQHGHLEKEQVLFICKSLDSKVMKKFIQDSAGLYYNVRLEKEINLRKAYSESRSSNRKSTTKQPKKSKKISKSYDKHMEDENKDENKDNNIKKKSGKNHLFSESQFVDFEKFEAEFKGTDYEYCDLKIYYENVKSWSAGKGMKRIDWIATARTFMLGDKKQGKLILKNGTKQVDAKQEAAGNAVGNFTKGRYAS
jgi:uncharacterized protein YdaU (DUF1376 family)